MKALYYILAGGMLACSAPASGHEPENPSKKESNVTYQIQAEKSSFTWKASKVTGDHTGTVDIASGFVNYNKGMLLGGMFEIDMRTIANTDLEDDKWNKKLVGHLKSDDFFSVEKHPKATLKIKVWAPIKDAKEGASNYYIKGDLTIKGITEEITFPAHVNLDENSMTAKAAFDIDRTKFDIRYRSGKFFPDIGDKMIEDMFRVNISMVAQPQASN